MDIPLEKMDEFARQFVAALPASGGSAAHVVGLQGDLGAGKTTFVQHVAKALGVTAPVTSPTFVLVQRYETAHPVFTSLVHIDAYRLEGEVKDTIGLSEYLADSSNLVLIEWPENVSYMIRFPADTPILRFETVDETTRKITLK